MYTIETRQRLADCTDYGFWKAVPSATYRSLKKAEAHALWIMERTFALDVRVVDEAHFQRVYRNEGAL